jgi:aminopeptidase N
MIFSRFVCAALVGAFAWCATSALRAEAPFDFAATPGKLPKEIVPRNYAVRLVPDLKTQTLTGSVTIDLEVLKPTRRIVLNARELEITKALLLYGENRSLKPIADEKEQTVSFELPSELKPGRCELALEFKGRINKQPQGLYEDRYQTASGEKVMLATQMEPVDARRMFPCWDEPVYRATFELTATIPEKWLAMSNMPIERERVIAGSGTKQVSFKRTPSMASYLVVFAAGELEAIEDEVDGIKLRVLCTEGKRESARYAMESTKKILHYYNEYFGVKYPLPKLDQLATPGGFSGAMENWGGIIYNEGGLLFDPKTSSEQTRERIFAVIAHEVAHQWFGDLVTMAWWDNLWLNEGFASWMGTKISDDLNPSWQVWLRADKDKERVMSLDARKGTHPIQQPVRTESEANAAFDEITYVKGKSFLRMLEVYLGANAFRDGMRIYMKRHQFSNTTTEDLWKALEEGSGKQVRDFAAGWTTQPGLPVTKIASDCKDNKHALTLTQERFTLHDPNAEPLTWRIPVRFGNLDDLSATTQVLVEDKPLTLSFGACDAAIFANSGDTGYFHTQYSPELFAALARRVASLSEADKLNLLGDTWAMAAAGRAPASDYLQLVDSLRGEKSLAVWDEILGVLEDMDRLERDKPGRRPLREFAIGLLRPVFETVGWQAKPDESRNVGLLRVYLIEALAWYGDTTMIDEVRERFARMLKEPSSLSPDLRPVVVRVVGRYADAATWNQLHDLARQSLRTEEKRMYYDGLQQAQDPQLANQTLGISLTDEMRPAEKNQNLFRVASARDGDRLVWDFFLTHDEKLMADIDGFRRHRYIPGTLANALDPALADELLNYMKTKRAGDPDIEANRVAERIRYQGDLRARAVGDIDTWVESRKATGPLR